MNECVGRHVLRHGLQLLLRVRPRTPAAPRAPTQRRCRGGVVVATDLRQPEPRVPALPKRVQRVVRRQLGHDALPHALLDRPHPAAARRRLAPLHHAPQKRRRRHAHSQREGPHISIWPKNLH